MGILKITKDVKGNVNRASTYVDRSSIVEKHSLNNLNNNEDYNYDFGNNSAGMSEGKIKNERGLIGGIITTILKTIIFIVFILGIIGVTIYFTKVKIEFFPFDKTLTLNKFEDAIRDSFIYYSGLLLFSCLLVKIAINSSVKGVFKRKYMSKFNLYIYDVFMVLFNVVVYVGVGYLFFILMDMFKQDIEAWKGFITIKEYFNISIFSYYKYAIVIVVSLFMAVNSFKGVGIVHKKNKFVFNDEV